MIRGMRTAVVAALVGLIRLYQLLLSPWIGPSCRFAPSCSEFCREALEVHGPLRGTALGLRRLLRCHPFGDHGYDPVPPSGRTRPELEVANHRTAHRYPPASPARQGQE